MTKDIVVTWHLGNVVQITVDEGSLVLQREEAEGLFVDLGYTLQDMDVHRHLLETGDDTDQPKE